MLVKEDQRLSSGTPSAYRPGRRGLEIVLWLSIPAILLMVHVLQVFESFSTVGCEGICDLDLSFGARAAYPWEVITSVAVAVLLRIVLSMRGKPTYWAAIVGVVLVLLSAIITSALFQAGLAPMYECNARIERGELPTVPPPPDPVGAWGTGVDGEPYLEFSSDGTLSGYDGCNNLTGQWTQYPDGKITFEELSATTNICDGVDTWLSKGQSAMISLDFLYVHGSGGSVTGGLPPMP